MKLRKLTLLTLCVALVEVHDAAERGVPYTTKQKVAPRPIELSAQRRPP